MEHGVLAGCMEIRARSREKKWFAPTVKTFELVYFAVGIGILGCRDRSVDWCIQSFGCCDQIRSSQQKLHLPQRKCWLVTYQLKHLVVTTNFWLQQSMIFIFRDVYYRQPNSLSTWWARVFGICLFDAPLCCGVDVQFAPHEMYLQDFCPSSGTATLSRYPT